MSDRDVAEILRRLDRQDTKLAEIHEQAKRTNGRVAELELWRARLQGAADALSWRVPVAVGAVGAVAGAVARNLIG